MPYAAATFRAWVFACLLALVAAGAWIAAFAPGSAPAAASAVALDPEERALCKQINRFRAQHHVTALRLSTTLTKAAGWMSRDMAASDVFDHVDSRGRDFDERIRAFGYRGRTLGENLAGGSATAPETFRQLRDSPEHRRTMLRPQLRVVGIGRAYGAGTMLEWYWTTTFGALVAPSTPC